MLDRVGESTGLELDVALFVRDGALRGVDV